MLALLGRGYQVNSGHIWEEVAQQRLISVAGGLLRRPRPWQDCVGTPYTDQAQRRKLLSSNEQDEYDVNNVRASR